MVVRFRDTGGLTSVGKVLMPETNTKTDAELVVAAAGGDDSAFADLYELYFDRVYDFVRRMVRDADDAADVAQDAFVKAMGGIAKLKDASSFKTWIFSIARNTALNRIEQSGRVVHDREDEEGDSLLYRQVDTNALDNPEQAADANEMAALVWEAASQPGAQTVRRVGHDRAPGDGQRGDRRRAEGQQGQRLHHGESS
jgi:RNA polymerase sigma factor (sigma-70 family)